MPFRDLREEFHTISNREQESQSKRKDLEKRLEVSDTEHISLKNDLRLALQRITDLQHAMEEGDQSDRYFIRSLGHAHVC